MQGSTVRGGTRADDLLDLIFKGGETEINPVIDLSRPQGFYYPLLEEEGYNPSSAEELEELVGRGDMERVPKYTLLLCPKDDTPHLRAAQVCPSCGSEDVHKEVLLEHFRCGHIAPEVDFRTAEGLVCPKCGKALKLLGKDFRRPADFHRCGQCGETTYIPDLRLHCTHCGQYYAASECRTKVVNGYRLREDEKPAAVYGVLREAAAVLNASGYKTKLLQDIQGRSGVKHRCDLYAVKEIFGLKAEVLLDVAVSSKPISSRPLTSLFAKGEDLRISQLLFLAIPSLEDAAKAYAEFHGIRFVESDRAEVHEKVTVFLAEELFLSKRKVEE